MSGDYYFDEKEYAKAIIDYKAALPNSGNPDLLYFRIAKVQSKMGLVTSARLNYKKALKLASYLAKDSVFVQLGKEIGI